MANDKGREKDKPESTPPEKKNLLGHHAKALIGVFGPETDKVWRAIHAAVAEKFPGLQDNTIVKRIGKVFAGMLDDYADVVKGPAGVLLDVLSDGIDIVFAIKDPEDKTQISEAKIHWVQSFEKSAHERIEKATQAGATPKKLEALTRKLGRELEIRKKFFDKLTKERTELEGVRKEQHEHAAINVEVLGKKIDSATKLLESLPGGKLFKRKETR